MIDPFLKQPEKKNAPLPLEQLPFKYFDPAAHTIYADFRPAGQVRWDKSPVTVIESQPGDTTSYKVVIRMMSVEELQRTVYVEFARLYVIECRVEGKLHLSAVVDATDNQVYDVLKHHRCADTTVIAVAACAWRYLNRAPWLAVEEAELTTPNDESWFWQVLEEADVSSDAIEFRLKGVLHNNRVIGGSL